MPVTAEMNAAIKWGALPITVLLLSLGTGISRAQDFDEANGFILEGLLIDRTLTLVGHEFFVAFSAAWRDSLFAQAKPTNLIVSEKPSARWGSLIRIQHNQRTVYRTVLHPRRIDLKPMAQAATRQVQHGIIVFERENNLHDNGDLLGDGF